MTTKTNTDYLAKSLATDNTPRQDNGQFKKHGKLTPKNKGFVKARIDKPKSTLAEQVLEAGYNAKSKAVASQIGGELLKKPEIIMALNEHAELFESAIVGVVRDWQHSERPRQREIAVDAAKYGHDKIFGKAKQTIESHVEVVRIAINLTGDGDTPPNEIGDVAQDTFSDTLGVDPVSVSGE